MLKSAAAARDQRRKRRYRRATLLAAIVLALGTVFVFTKQNPFVHTFELRADFSSVAQLHLGGQVRIAGIQVGQVNAIAAGSRDSSIVTMAIDSNGLPIHTDATLTIKPRLVLEGNAYIDLQPGSPAAPELHAGALVPNRQTATSVQIDQLLDTFNMPTRDALQSAIAALATGSGPRNNTGAAVPGWAGLREAVRQFDLALPPATQVARAVQGTQPGDLGRAIGSTGDLTAQLAENPAALSDAVSSYNTTFAALAAEDKALAGSVSGLDTLVRSAPGPLRDIDRALPQLTRLATHLRPTLHAIPNSLTNANALLDQIAGIVRPTELPALLTQLGPVLNAMPGLESQLQTLFGYTTPVTSCIADHVVPTLNMKVPDGVNTSGDPVYLDLVHLFTGLSGFSSAVDGNGGTVRVGVTTGDHIVDSLAPGLGQLVGLLPNVNGVRPTWLGYGVLPPFRPDQPCATQPLPNLALGSGPVPQWASSQQLPLLRRTR